jgi:PAS domain S-box-containing protein
VWLHIGSDLLIWLAYLAIPLVLLHFIRRRPPAQYTWIFWVFCGFIAFCGSSHLVDSITFFAPAYRLSGLVKLATAVVSWLSALLLIPLVPRALALRSPRELEHEIDERKKAEAAFRQLFAALETRVKERTVELMEANKALEAQIAARTRLEEELMQRAQELDAAHRKAAESLAVLDAMMSASPVGFALLDEQFRHVHVNEALAAVARKPREELLRLTVREAVPFVADRVEGFLQRVLRSGETITDVEYQEGPSDRPQETRYWLGDYFPVRRPDGSLLGVGVALTDITRLKRAEADAARASRQRDESFALLDTLLANAPIGLAFLDRDLRYVRINRALAEMNGRPVQDHVGRTVGEMVPELWPTLEPAYRRVLETGERIMEREVTGNTPASPSEPRHWLASYYPVHTPSGQTLGVGIVVSDVTERMRLREELQQRIDQLGEADRHKNEFLAMLAHELRNPLAPIFNALHIMRLVADDTAAVGQARELLERQVRHLARLVDDLLDVSRITRGKIELRKETVDVTSIVARSVESVRPFIDARRQVLAVSLPRTPIYLEGDPTRLEQILTNLLNNAAKYTDEGGKLWLSAEREDDEVVLCVRDNGMGIEPTLLPRVFDLFTQAERSLDRKQGGLGIGLTLVRRLVEMHGGKVAAASDGAGQGSEFTIRLPAMPALPRPRGQLRPPRDEETAALPPCRVLVVEDNADSAEWLARLLTLWGYEAQIAYDGPTALERWRTDQPEVVLLDIGLPGMNGYQVARRVRELSGPHRPFLLALTGYGQQEDHRRSRESGFDHHLVKPVDPEELKQLLARRPVAVVPAGKG